jgi:hypothetical protein
VLVRGFLFAGESVFKVEDVLTAPGTHFLARLYLTHQEPLQGFEVALLYDSTVLTLKRITMQGTDAESLLGRIELFVPQVVPDYQPGLGLGSAGVIFDEREPYDGSTLPPGELQSILSYEFEAAADARLNGTCTTLRLSPRDGPKFVLIDGQVCFEPARFLRGDSNNDLKVNVADAIWTIYDLFLDSRDLDTFNCQATMDANGDNGVDVSDPIYLLQYLFLGGSAPPPPFSGCDADPRNTVSCPPGSHSC